jgi:beta-galactosidase
MATVTYDNRSFIVDGRRVWLTSGALHYFRVPAPLWRDRLMKLRRAGLNCVETYVAWNVHEPAEGKWDFSGDRNVVEFINQAGDMGLYVIVRPGPYICAEWDFGGFPAYLRTKGGVQYRTNNAVYTHYYDKYFRQVLPRLADLQVTRGGNIIAIQNENEYFMTTMPDRMEYLNFITQMYRRAGFDIPILTCNWFTEPMVEEAIECNNCWENGVSNLKRLRSMQPDAPLLTTEFWPGWFDWWGAPHHTRDDRESARRALELIGAGSQVNYYMFHGGTNFGFWGGRSNVGDHAFITTSYDYDAPIAEGGGLSRKYYLLRLVNMLSRHLDDLLAAATPVESSVLARGPAALTVAGPRGRLTVVTNNGDDAIVTASLTLHSGRTLEVDLSHFGATAVAEDVPLTETHVLDYSNLMPLGFFAGKALVLHGAPGQAGVVSINGQELALRVPEKDEPLSIVHQGLGLLVMPSRLAERCWLADEHLFVGPDFVGETVEEVVMPPATRKYITIALDGAEPGLALRAASAPAAPKPAPPPTLSPWRCVHLCGEPGPQAEQADSGLSWQRLDRPKDLDALGQHYGYGWYRLTIESPRATRRMLLLPQCEDRATLWLNGEPVGVWGRGPGAQRTPLAVNLHRGPNTLTLLADNLGRFNFGFHIGEPKGLWGDVYDAAALRPGAWKIHPATEKDFPKRIVPRNQMCLLKEMQSQPLSVCETTFTLPKPMAVHLQYNGLAQHVAVSCNDRPAGFFAAHNGGFADVTLSNELKQGVNRLRLLVWGEVSPAKLSAAVHLHRLEENLSAGLKWRFRPWAPPAVSADVTHRNGHHWPAWHECTFKAPPANSPPLFVRLQGASKGQLYLNGHNIGRFWVGEPQELYYLPSCWLLPTNRLLIFDEHGQTPRGSKLEFRPLGPYRTEEPPAKPRPSRSRAKAKR